MKINKLTCKSVIFCETKITNRLTGCPFRRRTALSARVSAFRSSSKARAAFVGYKSLTLVGFIVYKLFFRSVVSWVVSPVLAGTIASSIYLVIKFRVMRHDDPFESALNVVPLFLWFMIVVIVFGVLFNGSKCKSRFLID